MEPTRESHIFTAPAINPIKYNPYWYLSDVKCFINYVVEKLEWKTLTNATVLDVGCGTVWPQLGDWLYDRFPDMSCIVALDQDPEVIRQCKRQHDKHAPIQFVVGSINDDPEQIRPRGEWVDKFDKVMSLNCFQFVPDLILAFDNLYSITKPSGEIAIAFCLWSGLIEMIDHVKDLKKWDKYERQDAPKAPCLQYSNKDASVFQRIIRKRGFNIVQCEKIEVEQPYESDEECKKDTLESALLAFDIPSKHLSQFSDDVYKCFLECSDNIGDGQKVSRSTHLMVLARKYDSPSQFSDSTTDSESE